MSGALRLDTLLAGIAPAPSLGLRGLALDSAAIRPGDVFVALRGSQQHGGRFAADAVARGAVAVLSDETLDAPPLPLAVPVLVIDGLRRHLGLIAARCYGTDDRALEVIGVTGTNGKTSCVTLLAQALNALGRSAATIGTLGVSYSTHCWPSARTTPDVLRLHALLAELAAAGARQVAMEVSSHALDQARVAGVHFRIAAFTNLSRDHLDYHDTMARYFAAKARLFLELAPALAVVNCDDPWGQRLLQLLPQAMPRCSYSASGDQAADWRAEAVEPSRDGLAFSLVGPSGRALVSTALLGRFNVANLLLVAACMDALGIALDDIARALAGATPVPGRMNRLGGDGTRPLVVIDYAHTPDALEQALLALREHAPGKLIVVFGCGGERDPGKRPQMGAIAERLAEQLIVTDDNPRGEDGAAIIAAIQSGMRDPAKARIERDRRLAIAAAIAQARSADTVLIAGKGHEQFQEIAGVERPFDDLREAASALERAA